MSVVWNVDSASPEAHLDIPLSSANPAIEIIEEQLPPPDQAGLGPPSSVAAVCLCAVFAFLNLYVTQPLLPLFTRIFHEPKSIVGLTASAATLGVALSAPIMGTLAERFNRKRVIFAATIALSMSTLLAATSPGLRTLVFWRFLQGLILPGVFTITYIGEEWDHHAVPVVMSIYVSGTALGGFIGRITAGLVTERLNWRWSLRAARRLVVVAGLGLVCTGVFIAQATANSFLRLAAPPGTRASAAGLYICCYYLGGTAAGVLPSYLWDWENG